MVSPIMRIAISWGGNFRRLHQNTSSESLVPTGYSRACTPPGTAGHGRTSARSPGSPLRITEAVGEVVVHHSDGLHEGVANRGADERESALLQIFAHGVGSCGAGGNLFREAPAVHDLRPARKFPDIRVERPGLLLN